LQRMSLRLFAAHPFIYGVSVARSWVDFWTVPLIWEPKQISPYALVGAVNGAWWIEHNALRLSNVAFVLLVVTILISRRARTAVHWDLTMTTIAAIVLFSSVIQALADYGASSRYAVTVQALVVLVVMISTFHLFREWRASAGGTAATRESSPAL
jgi:hypothetical protein